MLQGSAVTVLSQMRLYIGCFPRSNRGLATKRKKSHFKVNILVKIFERATRNHAWPSVGLTFGLSLLNTFVLKSVLRFQSLAVQNTRDNLIKFNFETTIQQWNEMVPPDNCKKGGVLKGTVSAIAFKYVLKSLVIQRDINLLRD